MKSNLPGAGSALGVSTLRLRLPKLPLFLFVALMAPLLLGVIVACGGDDSDEPETLTIYSGRSESLVGPIIEQFSDATGIQVSVKYASTSQMAATLAEEGDNTPADVFFAQDPGGLGSVEGMLQTIPQAILDKVPGWARSPEGRWVGISGRARVIVYNTEDVSPADMPADLWGFTDPKWKGRIGFPPTNSSFQTMVTGMRTLWGDDRTRQWLEGIKANEPRFYEKNTPTVAAAGVGEVDVGFVNHYYLYRFLAEEGEAFGARNHHLTAGGPGSLIMVAGAGILSASENSDTAERFLEFMLSPVSQQYFAGQTYEYPLVEGVTVNRLLKPLTEINNPSIRMDDLSDLRGTQEMLRSVGILP